MAVFVNIASFRISQVSRKKILSPFMSCCSPKYFSNLNSPFNPGDELVVVEKMRNITIIGINRPTKRNCVNFETAKCLREAFENFDSDNEADVAILHGFGGNFCAGYDLSEISDENVKELEERLLKCGPMGPSRVLCSKPVIAAVDGYTVAGGFELALMCDLRVVEDTASLGILSRRFGVPLVDGGTVRLPKLIGLSRALDLILTGRLISGKEALDWGIANRITACGTALGDAMSLARLISKFPQKCLRADRASAYHSAYDSPSITEALLFEASKSMPVLKEESISGAKKFMEGVGRGGKANFILNSRNMDSTND